MRKPRRKEGSGAAVFQDKQWGARISLAERQLWDDVGNLEPLEDGFEEMTEVSHFWRGATVPQKHRPCSECSRKKETERTGQRVWLVLPANCFLKALQNLPYIKKPLAIVTCVCFPKLEKQLNYWAVSLLMKWEKTGNQMISKLLFSFNFHLLPEWSNGMVTDPKESLKLIAMLLWASYRKINKIWTSVSGMFRGCLSRRLF